MLIILALLMFLVAVGFSLLGQGGGVIYTPIQVWTGVDFHVAAATSLFLIMVVSLSASLVFRKARKIDWPMVLLLEAVTIVGGFAGGVYSSRVSGNVLSVVFAGVVATAGLFMIRAIPLAVESAALPRRFIWHRQLGDQHYNINVGRALPLSLVAGLLSGMVGVGGGILKVPMMVLLFGIPLDIAIGSSAVMVGFTAAAGFAGHAVNGHWDWRQSLWLAVVVFAGGQVGSRISIRIDKTKLKKIFGWFLLVVALTMLLRVAVRP